MLWVRLIHSVVLLRRGSKCGESVEINAPIRIGVPPFIGIH